VVDWGSYRAGLEAYGEKLTGRKVEIAGPIGVRLFPWPRLTAGDVRIANPEGLREKWFATADQIVVRMNLGAMLNGIIQVESIEIGSPTIKLQRSQAGMGNWNFETSDGIRNSRLLEHVMLDKITVSSGTIHLVDDRRGSQVDFEHINSTLSAPNLVGPWRTTGSFDYDDLPLAFTASTGAWTAGAPLSLGLRVSSVENSGYSYSLDGQTEAGKFTGTARLDPVAAADGKSDSEGQFRPVTFKSKISASFEKVDLSEIEIRPADVSDQGTLLSGSASFTLDKQVKAIADLSAPRADFDALAGAGSRRLLRDGGGLALVNGLLAALPEAIDLRSSIKISALKAGGEVLNDVFLDVSANRNAMRIHELSASLPGRSRSLFDGVFFPGTKYAELAGNLAVESSDARQLSLWLWPDSKDEIVKTWTGIRGRIKAKAEVALTASKLELQNIEYELDGEPGKARLAVLVNGERPIIDLRVDTQTADIDSYVPNGFAALSSNGGASWSRLIENFVEEQVKRDLRLTFQAETLRLNGVEASDVAVDMETTVKGFDLKTIEAGSVSGAKLSVSGVVLSTPEGPDGEVGLSLTAEDPRELLRLIGLLPRDHDPRWSSVLGKTDLKINLQAKPSAAAPTTHYDVNGNIGDLNIASNGSFALSTGLNGTGLKGVTEISSPSSAALINLLGGAIETADAIPAKAVLTADGVIQEGFQVDLQSDVYRSRVQYRGRIIPNAARLVLDGDLTVQSSQARDLLGALSIPVSSPLAGQFSLASKINTEGTKMTFDRIDAKLADLTISGSAVLEDGARIAGDFSVSDVSLVNVMSPVFLPWKGRAATLEETFAKALPFGLIGEVWVRPKTLEVYPGLNVSDAQIGITATAEETRFAAYAKTAEGDRIAVEIASTLAANARKITGQLSLPFETSQQLKRDDGTAIASGLARVDFKFDSEGRSLGGALATLNGKGSFALADGKLLNISPGNFSKLIVTAKDAEGLEAAFTGLHGGDGIQLGAVFGSINIANGIAVFSPFGTTGPDATVLVKPIAELADGKIDIGVVLSLKALPELPPMEISYSGFPAKLFAAEDRTALTSYLGFKVLEQGVDELEKVQAEQQRLLIDEEKLRKEDQERLTAFYAQKAELRLRLRELKVQSAQRVLDVELAKAEELRLIKEGDAINRQELRLRLRELRVYRRASAEAAPLVTPREKPIVPQQAIQVPLILVPPAGP
jgi:uncharacterized protein involved in outer membrane biogenesis